MREYIMKVSDQFVKGMKARGMTDEYELIRCKDCKHWKNNIDADELTVCRLHGMFEGAWDYCSKAEMEEDNA